MKILFIGNSHTYYNDLPNLVAQHFRDIGIECDVTMIAHGGWFLEQHTKEPDVQFNIRCGHYDYVVLQEHAQPFGPIERFENAALLLCDWIRKAESKPVIYMTWAQKDQRYEQNRMNQAHRDIAEKAGALAAPVGESWWGFKDSHPEIEIYAPDGGHASLAGSEYAAKIIFETIHNDGK